MALVVAADGGSSESPRRSLAAVLSWPLSAADAAFSMADGAYSIASHSIAADTVHTAAIGSGNCIPSMNPSAYKLMSDSSCSPSEGENFSRVADEAHPQWVNSWVQTTITYFTQYCMEISVSMASEGHV